MKHIHLWILLGILVNEIPSAYCQQINIYSISWQRQTLGDAGYTLNGGVMSYSREKLLTTYYFGVSGVYPKPVVITDTFATTGSLTAVTQIPYSDIFFFGTFNKLDASFQAMTDEEIDSLYKWSKNGGKLMICEQPAVEAFGFNSALLDSKWGFSLTNSPSSNFIPTAAGNASDIFNGPFGTVASANEGGGAVGYVNATSNSIVLAENLAGNPTLILDCNTLDLIIADCDGYTWLGGISQGNTIYYPQDKFWANSIAYMDKLETTPSPVIHVNGSELSVGNYYVSYQWYLDGAQIPGADSSSYIISGDGEYTVEVTYQCGCVVKASPVKIGEGCSLDCNNLLQASVNSFQFTDFQQQKQLVIYNDIGQESFYSSNYQNDWIPPVAGIYYYQVQCPGGSIKKGKIVAIL